jgi:predicted alpha/beta superfamily hydrolase
LKFIKCHRETTYTHTHTQQEEEEEEEDAVRSQGGGGGGFFNRLSRFIGMLNAC